MPLSYHELYISECGLKQKSRQVLEMQHGRVTHMKEHETKRNDLSKKCSKAHKISTKVSNTSYNDYLIPTLVPTTLEGNDVLLQEKGPNKKYLQNLQKF